MAFEFLIPLATGVAANLAAALVRVIKERYDAYQKLRSTDETHFHSALTSDSLAELGGYLDQKVGKFSVREYAEDEKVRERINTFLARLEEFVGKPKEIPIEPRALEARADQTELTDSDLRIAQKRIERGAVWDGLSSLRRTIEARLVDFARRHEVDLPSRSGAGKILHLLRQRKIMDPDAERHLRYALDIANRGVHGLEVSQSEASEAVQETRSAFEKLELLER